MKKRLFIILAFTILYSALNGQQLPIYSQYWTNKFLLNPAIAGHEGYTSINLTARKQWANMKESPSTFALSAQTRYLKQSYRSRGRSPRIRRSRRSAGGKVGFGGYIYSDNLGVFNKLGFQGTYAYHLNLRRSQLSFGGSLSGMQYKINKDNIRLLEENDVLVLNTDDRGYVLDGSFGSYFSSKNLYAGFSIQNLFESYFKLNNREGSDIRLERQYILMSGYRLDIIDFIYVEPSFNFKMSENVVSQLDMNLSFYFKEEYWGGLGYRTGSTSKISTETLGGRGSSIIIYGGMRIDKFFFGYSFDYTLSSIRTHTLGSHELMLAVRFGDNARRYRWLNRY